MRKKSESVWTSLRNGLLLLALAAPLGVGAQTVNRKVTDFLGEERINELKQDKQGRETLTYLTFVADHSYYVVNEPLYATKKYPSFSEIVPAVSKLTGKSGEKEWVSAEAFNPLLYDLNREAGGYDLGGGNFLIILTNKEINEKLHGTPTK